MSGSMVSSGPASPALPTGANPAGKASWIRAMRSLIPEEDGSQESSAAVQSALFICASKRSHHPGSHISHLGLSGKA
eukprot:CAMPEP_0181199094 /NCGR_PEP_ID=MMETSP1096-20121128/16990_1 /TAXON_ID=156174 ORGANISM="Chrysochromulina ericina, Strain CCMP281" /NCGR_SAMPLE_ID=MMETSP1096 /ASSEMBLY_ACC=CAM_ASM_000453 /LENGTH=76 /DNA_ID=CAMNT_0023289247 /DNA_START=449 /DNA_END=679 /DNA_ORIENTATION=+